MECAQFLFWIRCLVSTSYSAVRETEIHPSPLTRVTVEEEASNEDTRAGNHLTHGVLRAHHLIGGRGEAEWFTQGRW